MFGQDTRMGEFSMSMMSAMDHMISMPAWEGAYKTGLRLFKGSEAEAADGALLAEHAGAEDGAAAIAFTPDGRAVLETVAFGAREEVERVVGAASGPLRAAVRLERDTWNGRDRLEGRLVTLAAD